VILKVSLGRVPTGTYPCFYMRVEPTTHEEHGEGLRFLFRIISGPYAGEMVTQGNRSQRGQQ
jgi:hypothetical protein